MVHQLDEGEALKRAFNGKEIFEVWKDRDGELRLTNTTQAIKDSSIVHGGAFLEWVDDPKPAEPEQIEEKAEQNPPEANQNEGKANQTPAEAEQNPRYAKLDDGKILALRKAGWSEANIAGELHTTQPTIHAHLEKMKKKGLI